MFNPIKLRIILLTLILPLALVAEELTIIAHRGNSSEAPENTLAAFQSAADHGFAYIECDIHLTKDGVPVVIHDRSLTRTTNFAIPASVEELTLEQIKYLDCGKWFDSSFKGETILTLKELLEAPLNGIGLMVEIKEGSATDEELVTAVLKDIHNHHEPTRPILIGSLSANIVKLLKEKNPHIKTIGIIGEPLDLLEHMHNDPDVIALNKSIASDPIVQQLHQQNKKVWVWTVDTPQEIEVTLSFDVDGVITNYPKRVRKCARISYPIGAHPVP